MSQTSTASAAASKPAATASAPEKYPFFSDNVEYWFEAKRAFGAAGKSGGEAVAFTDGALTCHLYR